MTTNEALEKWSECCAVILAGKTWHRQDNWRPLDRALRNVQEVQPVEGSDNVITVTKAGAAVTLMVR